METKKKIILSAALLAAVGKCLRTGQRAGGHHRSHEHDNQLFRPRHETRVRHRCGLRSDWRGKGI